jgi:hypothetical protein
MHFLDVTFPEFFPKSSLMGLLVPQPEAISPEGRTLSPRSPLGRIAPLCPGVGQTLLPSLAYCQGKCSLGSISLLRMDSLDGYATAENFVG